MTDPPPDSANETKRPTVPAIEDILFHPFRVLDHGFVRVIDYMGDDSAVVQAARVSYGRGTTQVQQDRSLIHYLMRHAHNTPFEMAEIKLHVRLPIFVARQWIRHRTANVNEYSARYSILDREFYLPEAEQVTVQSTANKQGRGPALSAEYAQQVIEILRRDAERNYTGYEWMLNDSASPTYDPNRPSLARELARINLTLSTYTQWYWKIDLHNLMHFLVLRSDLHAQQEIRVYADVILKILQLWVFLTYDAFLEHRLGAVTLSRTAVAAVTRMIKGDSSALALASLGKRERQELVDALGLENSKSD